MRSVLALVNRRAIQMKVSDFRLGMDFPALLATHLRMIRELGAVNQQLKAENGPETKVLKVRRIVWKPNVATHLFSAFARTLATMAADFWREF